MDSFNRIHRYENGVTLLFEKMDWTEAFAIRVNLRGGALFDENDKRGLAALTCEMTNRGAGEYDNRAFLAEQEILGIELSESAGKKSASFSAHGLVDFWERALELLALQIRRPQLDERLFDECRLAQLQALASRLDHPSYCTSQALSSILFPEPWGRPTLGVKEDLLNLTIEDVRQFHRDNYSADSAVIAVAGRLDWERIKNKVGELFADWPAKQTAIPDNVESEKSLVHIEQDTAQTHLRLGYRDGSPANPEYRIAEAGILILGEGMSSRLFTEVREKRGLCYSVSASDVSRGHFGAFACGCASRTERAQHALDVIIQEFDKLAEGQITESELYRYKIKMKSLIVMQRESAMARVRSMIGNWKRYKKIRTLEESLEICNGMTCEKIQDYFAERGKRRFKLATCGKENLEIDPERLG